MEKLTREQLNEMDKDVLVTLLLNMQNQLGALTNQAEKLTEQIMILSSRQFGRKSEKSLVTDDQITIYEYCANEAEAILAKPVPAEPEMDKVIIPEHTRRKRKGKRDADLSGFPVTEVEHVLSEEELDEKFPEGYTRLPDDVYRKLEMHPATFEVKEHHIAVYKGKDGTIIRGEHPVELLQNSIATPSLVSAIINAKYTNALPLYRLEQEYARNDVNISRQTMANWVIRCTERYLSLVYDRMKAELDKSPVIHADETPVTVVKDGREGSHKSYMWVYRSGDRCKVNPTVIYDFHTTRNANAPDNFLKGFKGKLVCDGYQVYHTLENRSGIEFTVAGCWAHARRKFADVVKALGEERAKNTIAHEALVQIQNIYHTDNALGKLPPSERKKRRKLLVKPLVDGYFEWLKSGLSVVPSSATGRAIQYSLNQEKYLRAFLDDPAVPLDNNIAERAIRPFCVGKKNWNIIDTIHGAEASAMLYSIVETSKANELNIYQYLKHLLTEIPKHMEDTDLAFLDGLLPWSKELPDECRKTKESK